MTVDIIILSFAKTQPLLQLTQRTIDSCHASEKDIEFNILVIEQTPGVVYANCKTHHLHDEFNYNRFMNIGIGMTSNPFVCLCNNDLLFHKGWCTNILKAMEENELLSASPYCPVNYGQNPIYKYGGAVCLGYKNHHHISGWCIMCDRRLFETIGPINEDFPFMFADNVYGEQLKAHGIRHGRVRNSLVTHLHSPTRKSTDAIAAREVADVRRFIAKYPDNESAVFFKKRLGM